MVWPGMVHISTIWNSELNQKCGKNRKSIPRSSLPRLESWSVLSTSQAHIRLFVTDARCAADWKFLPVFEVLDRFQQTPSNGTYDKLISRAIFILVLRSKIQQTSPHPCVSACICDCSRCVCVCVCVCVCPSLSVSLSVSLCLCLSVCLSLSLPFSLSLSLSLSLCMCVSESREIYLDMHTVTYRGFRKGSKKRCPKLSPPASRAQNTPLVSMCWAHTIAGLVNRGYILKAIHK